METNIIFGLRLMTKIFKHFNVAVTFVFKISVDGSDLKFSINKN